MQSYSFNVRQYLPFIANGATRPQALGALMTVYLEDLDARCVFLLRRVKELEGSIESLRLRDAAIISRVNQLQGELDSLKRHRYDQDDTPDSPKRARRAEAQEDQEQVAQGGDDSEADEAVSTRPTAVAQWADHSTGSRANPWTYPPIRSCDDDSCGHCYGPLHYHHHRISTTNSSYCHHYPSHCPSLCPDKVPDSVAPVSSTPVPTSPERTVPASPFTSFLTELGGSTPVAPPVSFSPFPYDLKSPRGVEAEHTQESPYPPSHPLERATRFMGFEGEEVEDDFGSFADSLSDVDDIVSVTSLDNLFDSVTSPISSASVPVPSSSSWELLGSGPGDRPYSPIYFPHLHTTARTTNHRNHSA